MHSSGYFDDCQPAIEFHLVGEERRSGRTSKLYEGRSASEVRFISLSSKRFLLPLSMCSLCADEGECFKTEVEQTYIMSSEIVHCLVRLSHKVTPLSYVKLDAFRIFG